AERMASLFRHVGICPGDKVCLYAINRNEWMVADIAAQLIGAVTVPIYSTLGDDRINYVLSHSETK
ncbi:hypothetical protein KIPB_017006, partial [Kipferlia bialata]